MEINNNRPNFKPSIPSFFPDVKDFQRHFANAETGSSPKGLSPNAPEQAGKRLDFQA